MANVKVFGKWVKLQGHGHKVKNYGTMKFLVMKNKHKKSLSLTIQKVWPMLSFWKVSQTSRSRSQGQKL
jgi:hypothetical protein